MRKLFLLARIVGMVPVLLLVPSVSSQGSEVLSIEDMSSIRGNACYSYCKDGYTCGTTQDCAIPLGTPCVPLIGNCTGYWERPENYSTCAWKNDPNSWCCLGSVTDCSLIYNCLCLPNPTYMCLAVDAYPPAYGGSYYPCANCP